MPLQSQPVPPDSAGGEEQQRGRVTKLKKEKLPWWIYFADTLDAVPFLAFLAGLIAFNKSATGKSFYAKLQQQFPNKLELANYMMESITGKVALGSFWGMVGLFALLDLLKWPKSLYKLKIQTNKEPPSPTYFAQIAALNVASTVLLLGPIGKYIIHPIWLKRGGVEHTIKGIPSAWTSLKEFVACEWWFQFWLYTSHRIMHLPSFYSWAHKRHHVHNSPFSVANFYATPFEHFFQNSFAGLALQFLPAHPSTAWFFIAYRYFETVTSHSGYAVPFATNALFHNYHHRMFEGSYGINCGFPLMDLLCGTCDDYLQWRYKWAKTHHWFTNQKLADDAELDVVGVDTGGASF